MIERGILRAFDAGTYKATVQFTGSLARTVTDVRVDRGIPSAQMVNGRLVAVIFFEEHNPRDAVLTSVWTS